MPLYKVDICPPFILRTEIPALFAHHIDKLNIDGVKCRLTNKLSNSKKDTTFCTSKSSLEPKVTVLEFSIILYTEEL